jgi:glucosyl-dolichyl phosphate glucuronosyltransferase
MDVKHVSVLICTYNRARSLDHTLDCFASLPRPSTYDADVIVVDNNSNDTTRDVVAAVARRSSIPIRYAFEARQGKSFALNTGLAVAAGQILALTDDDVTPARDWLDQIVDVFRRHDPVFIGGKVLPRWAAPPSAALLTERAKDVWGPLALVDYGEEPIEYAPDLPVGRRPIGANMAIRRDAMQAINGWRTDLGKVNNTLISGEDHEIYFRMLHAGLYRGRYEPRVIVHHEVPAARLTRRYFRRWFFANGQVRAVTAHDYYPEIDLARVPRIAGVPRFMYRQLAGETLTYLRNLVAAEPLERLIQELRTVRLIGTMWEWRRQAEPRQRRGNGSDTAAVRPSRPS